MAQQVLLMQKINQPGDHAPLLVVITPSIQTLTGHIFDTWVKVGRRKSGVQVGLLRQLQAVAAKYRGSNECRRQYRPLYCKVFSPALLLSRKTWLVSLSSTT